MTRTGVLFPAEVVVLEGDPDAMAGPLFAEEEVAVARAVPKRRREFVAGRLLAREALARLGFADTALPVGEGRAPAWPTGIIGSIAHTRGFVAVAVARRVVTLTGLGVDVEPDEPLRDAVLERIASPDEIERLGRSGDPLRQGRLLFCAKEALYKAQYPTTGRFLGFHDVAVELDVESGAFTARTIGAAAEQVDLSTLRGIVIVRDGYVIAGATTGG